MSNELDPRLKEFVDEFLDSFTSWDLILFFHHNPGVADSISGLAARLGRSVESVESALQGLVEKGVVKCKDRSGGIYFYEPGEEFKDKIEIFVQALEDRILRLKILSLLLRKGVK